MGGEGGRGSKIRSLGNYLTIAHVTIKMHEKNDWEKTFNLINLKIRSDQYKTTKEHQQTSFSPELFNDPQKLVVDIG